MRLLVKLYIAEGGQLHTKKEAKYDVGLQKEKKES